MLSTENPPPDLQCPCEISQLKSSNDEGVTDDNQHNQLEVDLFKSGLDDTNPLPKFSIRDYVFNTRDKDVKNNWPFSLKNLQLCLKHGVKDALPPFQSLDSVRNPPIAKCGVEKPEVSDHSTGQKLAEDTKNIDSSGSEEDKVFPSTTTSQSCSDINSAPQAKNLSLELEPGYYPGSPSKKLDFAAVQAPNKVKSNAQNPAKKCKVILKLKNIAEPKPTTEDLSVNNSVVSDTMATKVCPVCKTFSSSSNTTLNAHIDQCLSGESSMKWMTNSKAIKHRIKPRKTKMMADIYETALHCTLEELDRRNGTNWASNLGFTDQELQTFAEEKDTPCPSVNVEEKNQEGPVYIDSNGTKLRILSKLSDLPSNVNVGQMKFGKRDKDNKLLSSKKRKLLVQKQKIMKSLPQVQRSSPRHHPEANGGQQKDLPTQGYDDDRMQPVVVREQMKSNDMGMIKQWVGSKRTGLKKINPARENRSAGKIMRNSARNGASSLEERDSSSLSPVSYDENPLLPAESNKRRANLLGDSRDGCFEQLAYRKKAQGFSLDSDDDFRVFSKPTALQSRNDNPSPRGSSIDLPNRTENHVFTSRSKKVDIDLGSDANAERPPSISSRSVKNAVAPGGKKFSSLKKKLLSAKHTSVQESKKKLGRKHLRSKHSRLHRHLRSEEERTRSRTESHSREMPVMKLGESAAHLKKVSTKSCVDGARVSKIPKKRAEFINTSKGDTNKDSAEVSPGSESRALDKNNDSFNVPLGVSNVLENDKTHNEFAYEPTYKIPEESFAAFSKSLDTAFHGLGYPSDVGYVPQQYNKAYEGRCLAEPPLGGEQDGFCADKIGGNLMTSSSHVMVEMDASEAQGNYFVDVDPIPIPGPPGSFLPSPGRMSSEELQGNSSLTACMMQSSENEHEVVDMDSSDSPVSATSVVSDSVATRSNSVSMNLPEQSHNETTRCDIPEGGMEPVAQGSASIEQTTTAVGKFDPHEPKSNSTLPEMTGHRFKSIPPCRCSRKDGVLLGDSLINRDFQFVRQQTIAYPPVFVQEKKVPDALKEKPHLFSLRSETLPVKELTPEPGKFVANSPMACSPLRVSHHLEAKFPIHGDCESPSPSTSNPVLRLMGKNLMVVNKDENLSPQTWHGTQSSMVMNHPGPRLPAVNSLSTGKNQEEIYTFNPTVSRGSSAFFTTPAHSFDFNPYDGFGTPAPVRPPQLSSSHPSMVMFSGGNLVHSLKHQEYASLNRNQVYTARSDTSVAYDIDNVRSPVPNLMRATADFSARRKRKEIIVIDDSPENEAANIGIEGTLRELNRNMKFGESSAPQAPRVNPFYNYQPRMSYPLHTGPPVVQNGNTQVPSVRYYSPSFS